MPERKVLIVDDSHETVGLLSLMVLELGHEPINAYSGEQALDLLLVNEVDIVLLDYMMPGLDGLETLAHIRAISGMEVLPVFIVTASEDESVEEKAREAGANGYLKKPVGMAELRRILAPEAWPAAEGISD